MFKKSFLAVVALTFMAVLVFLRESPAQTQVEYLLVGVGIPGGGPVEVPCAEGQEVLLVTQVGGVTVVRQVSITDQAFMNAVADEVEALTGERVGAVIPLPAHAGAHLINLRVLNDSVDCADIAELTSGS